MLRVGQKSDKRRKRLSVGFERRLFFSVLLTGVPGVALGLFLLWSHPYSLDHKLEGTVLVIVLWLGLGSSACEGAIDSLRALSNVIASLKEEDFSFRATRAVRGDALGDLAIEVNNLARALEEERLRTLDSANLFRNVMDEAGAAILAFSSDNRLRMLNRGAAALLGHNEELLRHRTAKELGIDDLLAGPPSETMTRSFHNIERRWLVRRTKFRQHGVQHLLLVMSEASVALRTEELSAWKKLVRVLGHEINNSLAPIKSIAHTLKRLSATVDLPDPFKSNLGRGLEVIAGRSDSLNRFLQNYTQFAKLPPPQPRVTSLDKILSASVGLESRLPVTIVPGQALNILVDPDQLEQVLVNIVRNAVDAVLLNSSHQGHLETVTVSWQADATDLELWIRDRGIGLPDTQNLFVPFYTTKDSGSGIGLVLSRQIIEAHNGQLTVQNRKDGPGCEVKISLPMCIVENAGYLSVNSRPS